MQFCHYDIIVIYAFRVILQSKTVASKERLKQLRALMDKHGLAAKDVAQILETETHNVYRWLSESQTAPIPKVQLRLLACELELRKYRRKR